MEGFTTWRMLPLIKAPATCSWGKQSWEQRDVPLSYTWEKSPPTETKQNSFPPLSGDLLLWKEKEPKRWLAHSFSCYCFHSWRALYLLQTNLWVCVLYDDPLLLRRTHCCCLFISYHLMSLWFLHWVCCGERAPELHTGLRFKSSIKAAGDRQKHLFQRLTVIHQQKMCARK